MLRKSGFIFMLMLSPKIFWGFQILIPMDETQRNHLKAYGIAYWVLKQDLEIYWLLNYRGGSFLLPGNKAIINECNIRGVSY